MKPNIANLVSLMVSGGFVNTNIFVKKYDVMWFLHSLLLLLVHIVLHFDCVQSDQLSYRLVQFLHWQTSQNHVNCSSQRTQTESVHVFLSISISHSKICLCFPFVFYHTENGHSTIHPMLIKGVAGKIPSLGIRVRQGECVSPYLEGRNRRHPCQ